MLLLITLQGQAFYGHVGLNFYIKHFQLGAEFVFVHVPSLWVPSLQGAEVVGAEFARFRVCRRRVCKVPKWPVPINNASHQKNELQVFS